MSKSQLVSGFVIGQRWISESEADLGLGIVLYPALKKGFPDQNPLTIVNSVLFYWIIGDLVFRFFFQKLPVMIVKPLLVLPIKRREIVNYVLGKSVTSFFSLA